MIEALMQFFKKSAKETAKAVPDGFCPNCWGEQEYDKVIRQLYKDKQIDVNNYAANYAFIQDFIVNQLNGIHLIKGNNGMLCPTCKT
jgi:hypothetical protein